MSEISPPQESHQPLETKRLPRIRPVENHEGLDYQSPLHDAGLNRIRQTPKLLLDTPSLSLLGELIDLETKDVKDQQDASPWITAQKYFQKYPQREKTFIDTGEGKTYTVTRDQVETMTGADYEDLFDPTISKLENLSSTVTLITDRSVEGAHPQVHEADIADLLKYVKHNQQRWEKKLQDVTHDPSTTLHFLGNYNVFRQFESLLHNYRTLRSIDEYRTEPQTAEAKIQEKEHSAAEEHPYLLRFLGSDSPIPSPKKEVFLKELGHRAHKDEPIGFEDVIEMWKREEEDITDQSRQITEETLVASAYFAAHREKDEVTVYAFSDGRFDTDHLPGTGAEVVDKRIFQVSQLEELQSRLKKLKALEPVSPLKKAIARAQDILDGNPVEGTKMNNELESILELEANKEHGKLKEAFEKLRESAHNYLGIYDRSLEI